MTPWSLGVALLIGAVGCGASAAPPQPVAHAAPEPAVPSPETPVTAPPVDEALLQQELEDVTFRQTRGTATQWELHAAHVWETQDQPARLESVTLRYYGEEPEPTVITADEAEYDVETQHATLRGHVRIITPAGERLESNTLHWNGETRMARTDDEVTLWRNDSYITGVGLKTSPGLQDLEMLHVHGVFRDVPQAG